MRFLHSEISIHRRLIVSCILMCSIHGILSFRDVELGSIEIFTAHEWLAPKPTIYFYCQGENKTILPDVKEKHFYYTFKGKESWQPLTELPDKKCKRCGLYEMDRLKSDDVFDEWELCPDEFVNGKYVRYKEKEYNATFICNECTDIVGSNPKNGASKRGTNIILAVLVGALVAGVTAAGTVVIHKYWQKRKRERDQARFLKLFEEGDDIEDELGLNM